MVPDATPQAPTPQPEQVANPFLAQEPTPEAPSTPRVLPLSQGAPLKARPGVVAPDIRDAHAEFRKGGWKKPLLFGLIAAAIAGGLFFGIPKDKEEESSPLAESTEVESERVIGASVSPDVILDPDKPSLQNPKPVRRVKTDEELEQEQPRASPDRADRSDGFADAFKSNAK